MVGDKGMFNALTYKSILSFDTSQLPSGITITSAELILRRKSLSGNINSIQIDMRDGHFGSSNSLEQSDYYDPASAYNVTNLNIPSQDNTFANTVLPASSFQYIKNGADHRTQFRLTASVSVPTFAANQMRFYSGVSETESNTARLVVRW